MTEVFTVTEVDLRARAEKNREAEKVEHFHLAERRRLDRAARKAEDASRAVRQAAAELDAAGGAIDERREFVSMAVSLVSLQKRLQDSADSRGKLAGVLVEAGL